MHARAETPAQANPEIKGIGYRVYGIGIYKYSTPKGTCAFNGACFATLPSSASQMMQCEVSIAASMFVQHCHNNTYTYAHNKRDAGQNLASLSYGLITPLRTHGLKLMAKLEATRLYMAEGWCNVTIPSYNTTTSTILLGKSTRASLLNERLARQSCTRQSKSRQI